MVGLEILFIILLLTSLERQVKAEASDHRYNYGDTIPIYAKKVGPYSNPLETYDYYNLLFCSTEKKVNLSETLTGEHFDPTLYQLEFLVDKEFELSCKKRLKTTDVSQFLSIEKDFYMHLYCDDIPVQGFVGSVEREHRDERNNKKYFLYNHIHFEIFYNEDRVIEILLQADPDSVVDTTQETEVDVNFTYSVKWMATQQRFDERMQTYEGSPNPKSITYVKEDKKSFDSKVHGRSIADSCFLLLIVIFRLLLIYYKWNRQKDISRHDVEEADNQEETGWKSIRGDVFRFPEHKSLFAAALGCGTQLIVLVIVILLMGVMGLIPPYLDGDFLLSYMSLYILTSAVAVCTSVSFYRQLEGTKWVRNLLLAGGLHFGPLFLTFNFNSTVAVFSGSTDALPLVIVIIISLYWILMSMIILLCFGVLIEKNKKTDFQAPCKTAKCPREVPRLPWYRGILPQMVMAGFIPFSVIHIPLFEMLSTLWGHGSHISYSFMSIVFFLLLIFTALVSLVMTALQLACEDHKWWWRSFFCGGSTGLYVYGYSIYYYLCLSDINGFMQTFAFFSYMACLSYGMFLLLGTVGFHASLLFVRRLYTTTSS